MFTRYFRFSHRKRYRFFRRTFLAVGLLIIATLHFYKHYQVRSFRWNSSGEYDENLQKLSLSMNGGHDKYRDYDLMYIDIGGKDVRSKSRKIEMGLPQNGLLSRERKISGKDFYPRQLKMKNDDTLTPKNEIAGHRNPVGIPLQPWAVDQNSFEKEAKRFLQFLTTPQGFCQRLEMVGCKSIGCHGDWPWRVCFRRLRSKYKMRPGCVVYSFSHTYPVIDFEHELADAGCEVHVFDPTLKTSRHDPKAVGSDVRFRNVVFHKISLDWRISDSGLDPFGKSVLRAKNLKSIMEELGHDKIDIFRADLESSEWKVMENIVSDGTIKKIEQLLLIIHLHWGGFEVSGSSADIVRFWYSVLYSISSSHFDLVYSTPDKDAQSIFLGRENAFNTSGAYVVGWMNNNFR